MNTIKTNWYNLIHGATVGMFGYIVSNSLNVALITFCGATLMSCVLFTKEITKEDRSNLKIGIAISSITMAGVTIGQLIIPDFAVKGEPIHSALFTMGFLLLFAAICTSDRVNINLMHAIYDWMVHVKTYYIERSPIFLLWIYVNVEHIRNYHTKAGSWYIVLFSVILGIGGYVISKSLLFALFCFGMGVLLPYTLFEVE